MSFSQVSLIIFTIFLISAGQILFKWASQDIVLTPTGFLPSLFSLKVLLTMTVYGVATLLWFIALKNVPLRLAYPFAAMAFFIVPTLAHFILGESLNWNVYVGAAIIGLGVFVSVMR